MMHTLKRKNKAGFYTMLCKLYAEARQVFVLSFIIVLTSLCSDGQVYLVDEASVAQAMQILDIHNMPVDPQFQGL